jgi:hypothetical protein
VSMVEVYGLDEIFFVIDTAAGTLQPFFNRGMAIQRKKVVCCKFMSLQCS